MVISKTPFRISFFGGGTDYPAWYLKEGGAVLSTTIDKYCYISCRVLPPFFNIKHRIVWSHIETVSAISDILHPAVREGLRYLNFDDSIGLEIHHQGDLPARSGMGSSSSFAVGLINALMAVRGQCTDKRTLGLRAIELEQSVLKDNVGSQDQVAAAHGGFNTIHFCPTNEIIVEPISAPVERIKALQSNLLLFYLGMSRSASEIAAKVIASFDQKQRELRRMRAMVDEAKEILHNNQSLDGFGELLNEAWMLKRGLTSAISSSTIDHVYQTALQNGALGGKLLGAGGTGFMIFYVPIEKQQAVRTALNNYLHVPFQFERDGSTLIHYTPEDFGAFQNLKVAQ